MTEVVYESKLLELIFGDYSYRINFSVSYPIYSVKIEIYDGITPEEAVNQAIKYLRQRILLEYKKTKSIRKVRRLVKDYMILLENREEIIKEIKEKIEKIQRMVEEYVSLKFPIEFNDNIRIPEINLNELPITMTCEGDIESGIFPLRNDRGLSYTYGERECEGSIELTFEWGTVIVSKKEIRDIHDTEHCLIYDKNESSIYVTIKPNNNYKVVKIVNYESYSSFYNSSSERFERILRATHKPIVKLVANSYSTYSDRHTYSESRFCEAYYVFPAEAKVLIKIAGTFQNKDYEHYEIR